MPNEMYCISKKIVKYIILKLLILTLLFMGVASGNVQSRLILLIITGVLSGLYNGYYADIQWRAQSVNPDNKSKKSPEDYLHRGIINVPYRVHQMFNHIVCGFIAAICLYLLISKINLNKPLNTVESLSLVDLALFIIALTGFAGILPRAIWFWSYGPKIKG